MKYIDRDNFRYLTGHGRDMAERVDWALRDWEAKNKSVKPEGNFVVTSNADIGESWYDVEPWIAHSSDREYLAGHKTSRLINLVIIAIRNGLMEITGVPLESVLKGAADYSGLYQIYQHDFLFDAANEPIEDARYIGITKRGWRTRWSEHLRAANSGSHYRFHRAIRQWYGVAKVVSHSILACGMSERAALAAEEDLVSTEALYPRGLNMVPGGNTGLAYLRRIGAIGTSERVSPDDRQAIINRFFERASRKGLPNPLAAANWLDSDYAEKVICSGPDRLKPRQIRDARFFSSLGQDAESIAARIGARNVEQVKRLLSGSTYTRIA